MRTSRKRLLVGATATVLLLTGCTPDQEPTPEPTFSTDGTLTPADLPEGSWTGPYESWVEAPVDRRPLRCQYLTWLWNPLKPPETKGTAAYADGGTVVWSMALQFATESHAEGTMNGLRNAEKCIPATPDPDYEFTFEDDGSTIITRDQNSENDRDFVTEVAVHQDGDTVVGVLVYYPTADPPDITAEGLLGRAVEVSADLQPVD